MEAAQDKQITFPDDRAPDIETASDEYARRFSGPVGAWMLQRQFNLITQMLSRFPVQSILEVGGGHAQLTQGLLDNGYHVHVQGSAESCRHRLQEPLQHEHCRYTTANLTNLPFSDRSFDAVISIRLVMHTDQWEQVVAEMCRIAREVVVIDYPSVCSFNMLAPLLFDRKKKIEKNTRTWRSFKHTELNRAFHQHHYHAARKSGQYVLPMALHRKLNQPRLSAVMEGGLRALQLHRLFGSPVIAAYRRLM